MKKILISLLAVMVLLLAGCDGNKNATSPGEETNPGPGPGPGPDPEPELDECEMADYQPAIKAISNRDDKLATSKQLISYSQCLMKKYGDAHLANIKNIYQGVGDTFSWAVGSYSHTFPGIIQPENAFSVLLSNDAKGNLSNIGPALIVAGEQQQHRYVAMAQNLANSTSNMQDQRMVLFKNLVSWLVEKGNKNKTTFSLNEKSTANKLQVVIAQQSSDNHYNAIVRFLDGYYPDAYIINDKNSCDYDQLLSCLQAPVDLLILSDKKADVGYSSIKNGVDYAIEQGIPLLTFATMAGNSSSILKPIYQYMGVISGNGQGNPWNAQDIPVSEMLKAEPKLTKVSELLKRLDNNQFDPTVFDYQNPNDRCWKSLLTCELPAFKAQFRDAADWYLETLTELDQQSIDVLSSPNHKIIAAGLLLADKYRQQIDYPITIEESAAFQQAMFADWLVNYARTDNKIQPDLGAYILDTKQVVKGSNASYQKSITITDTRTFQVPETNEGTSWTTSGWYAQAGDKVTISSDSTNNVNLAIQLQYNRPGTNKSAENLFYDMPINVSMLWTNRLLLEPGKTISFSSPYGAPIYIRFLEGQSQVTLTATGVAYHPSVLDPSDKDQIARFEQLLATTDIPHVDLRTEGVEFHMRKDKFQINDSYPSISYLLEGTENQVNWIYTLGGFKVPNKPLTSTLPAEVVRLCSSILQTSNDCTDESLHLRRSIQHANLDQYAYCGSGCSGNPRDGTWSMSPYDWGEGHELGHNLQVNYLNAQYVDAADKNNWTKYKGASTESSNNIFPYYMAWRRHYFHDEKTSPLKETHFDALSMYSVVISELRGLKNSEGKPVLYNSSCKVLAVDPVKPVDRYEGLWGYTDFHALRFNFYTQMAFHADKQKMRDGSKLETGFHIYTLLYQHSRMLNKYANNAENWNTNRGRLGFSDFAYNGDSTYGGRAVIDIPGNDFMLVSLSYLTHRDWRPFFDMFGLRYTDLASKQVDTNKTEAKVEKVIYVNQENHQYLPNKLISQDPDYVTVNLADKDAIFPNKDLACLKP